ncbi:MAG: glycosyltransferase family 4 protein [Chitinophagales bacterium]
MNTKKQHKKIAIICPYPHGIVAGQRFRYEQYLDFLTNEGYTISIFPFLDETTNNKLYNNSKLFFKIFSILKSLLKRFFLLFSISKYDYLFIYREATLIGPPFFEFFATKVLKKKIILDFDDAIWKQQTAINNTFIARLRHSKNKTEKLCSWAYKVSCGNYFLCDYVKKINENTIYIPTTIDTQNLHNQIKTHEKKEKTVIGWTGSFSTMIYLDIVYEIMEELAKKYPIEFHIISNKKPKINKDFIVYKNWNKETEIADLMCFDIGIMPLFDTEWEQGKCGFKALQYMALGIPALVSPVGVNTEIIENNKNGLFATQASEWLEKLSILIESPTYRQQLGKSGRKTIEKRYSVVSQQKAYLKLFSDI